MAMEGEISEGDSQKWPRELPRELPQNCPKNCPDKKTEREVCFPKGTKKAQNDCVNTGNTPATANIGA